MNHILKVPAIVILAVSSILYLSSCEEEPTLPSVSTSNVTAITQTTASSGGNVTDDGGEKVTTRGVCWSTSPNPTTGSSKTTDGQGTGTFNSTLTGLEPDTKYYARAYATNEKGTSYGNELTFTTEAIQLATLTTDAVSSITQTTALSGGNITDDGGADVLSRGICWSLSDSPTTADSFTDDGSGTGAYTSTLTGLNTGTTYYVRAYAINSIGTAYGNELTFATEQLTDADGNVYATVIIGSQLWMAENLKYLPSVVGPATSSQTDPYYYVYDYDGTDVNAARSAANFTTYGVLYNWPAAMNGASRSTSNPSGIQGACPTGWHLPSVAEWRELINYIGGTAVAGGKLKEAGTTHWTSPNTGATNESGFTALPGGERKWDDTFFDIGNKGFFWTTVDTFSTSSHAILWIMEYDIEGTPMGIYSKTRGMSVRCVKDQP
jgi:uncharacterized protein (TIGR02145 family)